MPKNKVFIKREYLLVAGILLGIILLYNFSIKKTISLYEQNEQLHQNLKVSSDLSFQPEYLERKKKNIDKILKKYQLDSVKFRGSSIAEISYIAEKENVKLVEIPSPDPFYNTQDFLVQRLDFQGDYFSILRMLEKLQEEEELGVMSSINLGTSKNNQDTKVLVAKVYLQIKK